MLEADYHLHLRRPYQAGSHAVHYASSDVEGLPIVRLALISLLGKSTPRLVKGSIYLAFSGNFSGV